MHGKGKLFTPKEEYYKDDWVSSVRQVNSKYFWKNESESEGEYKNNVNKIFSLRDFKILKSISIRISSLFDKLRTITFSLLIKNKYLYQ